MKGILLPYAMATLLYQIIGLKFFDLKTYLNFLINFNLSSPFYYVLFFVQLLIVSPFLYRLIIFCKTMKHYRALGYLLSILTVTGISIICFKYTFNLDVHGGGKHLFGGCYLLVFFLGMLYGSSRLMFKNIKYEIISSIAAIISAYGWYRFISGNHTLSKLQLDVYFPFGSGFNPPGISLIVYGILVVWASCSLFTLMKDCKIKWINKLVQWIGNMGRYSLYIFLYHLVVINHFLFRLNIENKLIKVFIYFASMIAFPIIGKIAFDYIGKWCIFVININSKEQKDVRISSVKKI